MGRFHTWVNQALTAPQSPVDDSDRFWQQVMSSMDVQGRMWRTKVDFPEQRATMLLGASGGRLRLSAPETSALVLGPPRSSKSSGYLIPAIWAHRGAVVSVSTKFDVARATALGQIRKGTVWHFAVDGSPCPEGFKELRWSPVIGADDWGKAVQVADSMVAASKPMGMGSVNEVSHHFDQRASSLLATICHYAARTGRDMEFVVDTLLNFDIKGELKPILDELQTMEGSERAARALRGILYLEDRERSSVFSTCAVVLKVYELPGALAMTKDPNFVPSRFAAGFPDMTTWLFKQDNVNLYQGMDASDWPKEVGQYNTIYITSPARTQELCAPLVTGLITAIQGACYDLARQDALVGKTDRAPVLFAIDELGLVSGWTSLPALLADGGSNNMLFYCCMQTLDQAERWGTAGKSFASLFGNVIAIKGIRSRETLELLSMLVGDFDREQWGGSWGRSGSFNFREWNPSQSWTRQPMLPPSQIYAGNPNNDDAALIFTPNGGWQWVEAQFYFKTGLWPALFHQSAELALRSYTIRSMGLPLPELIRDGDTRYLDALGGYATWNHQDLIHKYAESLAEIRAEEARELHT